MNIADMPDIEHLEKLIADHEKREAFSRQMLVAGPASMALLSKGRPSHHLAGKMAKAKDTGVDIEVEDWFEKIFNVPYLLHDLDRPPFILYFCRMAFDRTVPVDNDVVVVRGKYSSGLLHNSEVIAQDE